VSFLRAAGIDHARFLRIVRAAADDLGVLAGIERAAPGAVARLRSWTAHPPPICRMTFALVDADEGHGRGAARVVNLIPQFAFAWVVGFLRRTAPFRDAPR
jgi:hypothetical protein